MVAQPLGPGYRCRSPTQMDPNPYEPSVADSIAVSKTRHRRLLRFAFCVLGTTGINVTLLMMLPPGFAGVPYMVMALGSFVLTFALVAMFERSRLINVVAVAIFWLCLSVIHATHLGTAPMPNRRLADGLLFIGLLASGHMALQLLVHFWSRRSRDSHRHASLNLAANKTVHPSPRKHFT